MKSMIINFIKGIGIGASMLLPGVSGGTMAIMLNIYDELIHAVSSFFKNKKRNAILLGTVLLGGLVGVFVFSNPILYLTTTFEKPMLFLFIGAILGGVPTLFRKAEITSFKIHQIIYPLIGVAIVVAISLVPEELLNVSGVDGIAAYPVLFVVGIICAIGLVLPGISLSYVLLMFGLFEPCMAAINQLDFGFLLPFGIGGIFGTLATTKLLERAMDNHKQGTYLIIIGFLLSSIIEILPALPVGFEWVVCVLTLVGGFAGIYTIGKLTAK